MGIIAKIAAGLRKTRDSFINSLRRITNSFTKIDEDLFEALEEAMIMSDIGVETSEEICDRLRKKIKERGITDPAEIMELIHEVIGEIMGDDTGLDLSVSRKLCHQFKNEGKKVIVAAADTFRAAAIDQLQVWTDRAGVDIVKHAEGSDPGAVVYDALEAAKARGCDVVIIDTAGRLHNKKNLMDELAKINRIIDSKAGDCSREVLLVLDATTGQNAVNQAKLFSETAPISGIVLTKLDGTAKGGIVISIKNELGIPVKLIGVGEKIDDLQPFDSRTFVEALFSDVETEEAEAEEETELVDEESAEDAEYQDDEAVGEAYEEEDSAEAENEEAEEAVPETEETETSAPEIYEETTAETAEEATEKEDAPEPVEEDGELISQTGYSYNENYMDNWQEEHSDILDGSDEEIAEASEPEEETEEEVQEETQPEKKKKRGFFSRLFGRKKYEEEEEDTESEDEESEDEETDNGDE